MGRQAKVCGKIRRSGELVDNFMEIYAIIAADGQLDEKRGTLPGLTSVRERPKSLFQVQWSRSPHNLGSQVWFIMSSR
jgi:hypothetical protein